MEIENKQVIRVFAFAFGVAIYAAWFVGQLPPLPSSIAAG